MLILNENEKKVYISEDKDRTPRFKLNDKFQKGKMNLQDQAYKSILIREFYKEEKMTCTDTSPTELRVGNIIVHLDQLYVLSHSFSTQ